MFRTIRVKHCPKPPRDWPPGWYVQVRAPGGWECILELRFVRKVDAEMALAALVKAGLTTKRQIAAKGEEAIRTAIEALQW